MRKSLITFAMTLAMLLVSLGIKAQSVVYQEDFTGWPTTTTASFTSTGWDRSDNDPASLSTTYQWRGSSAGHDGYCAYGYISGVANLKTRLKSPTFVLQSMKTYILTFWMKGGTSATYCGTINIYYSTDGGATYQSNVVASNITDTTAWTEYTFALPSGCSGTVNLVFELLGGSSTSKYAYIDQLKVIDVPTCQSPAGLYLEGLTANATTLKWGLDTTYARFGADAPSKYAVTLKDSNDNVVYYNNAVTAQMVAFTGLMGNASYTASVLSDCGALGVTDSLTLSFNTLPPAINPPFYEDFETLTTLPKGYYSDNASIVASANTAYKSMKSVKLSTTQANNAYVAFPLLNIPTNDIEMDFFMRSTATVQFAAGYMTDPTDETTFIPVYNDSVVADGKWHNYRFNTSTLQDLSVPVMPCVFVSDGKSATIYLDNVSVNYISSCTRPEQLSFSNITSNQATVSWTMSTATSYSVNVMALSDSTVTTYTNCQNPYIITGLRQNAYYEVTVQAACSTTDSSDVSVPGEFKTDCGAIADTAIFFEGAENTTGTALPACWTTDFMVNPSGSTVIPFQTSTTQKIGTRSISIPYRAIGTISYLCSQGLNFDARNKYSFRYSMYRPSGTSYNGEVLKIFVTPTIGDTTNAVEVIPAINFSAGNAPAVSSTGWYEYEGVINYQGVGYIMAVIYCKNGIMRYIDNLEVFPTPSCPKVSAIKSGTVTSNSAKVTWTPGLNETQWIVNYSVKQGATDLYQDTIITNASNFVVSSLTPQTGYTIYGTVRALCGEGDTSVAVAFTLPVTTLCAPMSDIPYTYGFESDATGTSAAFPTCWSRFNDATGSGTTYTGYPYVSSSTTYYHGGSKGLYFYASTSATYAEHQVAILPQVDTAAHPMNTLRLKFWAKRSATASYADAPMIVGIMSDPADLSTFEVIDTLVVSNSANQQEFVARFNNYTGNGTYPAIRLDRQASTCYCYVDDITLEELPNCLEIGATVSDIDANSVTITINDSTAASGWSYAYGLPGTDVAFMPTVDTAGMTVVIGGLNLSTKYDLYVRRNCGSEHSEWSQKVTFTTTSIPATIPYVCDFEDDTESANWLIVEGANATNKFAVGSSAAAVHSGSKAFYVSNDNGVNNAYTLASCATRTFAYRTIHFDAKEYKIEFFWRCPGGEGAATAATVYDYGRVMLIPVSEEIPSGAANTSITTANPRAGFSAKAIFLNPDESNRMNLAGNDWHLISKTIDFDTMPGNYNLVLAWNNDGSGGTAAGPLSIDDIAIYGLDGCTVPNVSASGTSNSITLDVSASTSASWEFVVDSADFSRTSIPAAPMYRRTSTTGSETFTGLNSNKPYYYSVRSICGESDTSLWSTPTEFRTFCTAYDVPYTEGFEDENTVTCWSLMASETSGTSMEVTTAFQHSGLVSLKGVKAAIISPEYDVDSLTHYMINGWVYAPADSTQFSVGVIVNPNDPTTYEVISDILVPAKNTWTEFTAYFTALTDPDYARFKTAKNIVLACGGENTFYFDDIFVDETPTCPKPTEVRISNIQAHSFDINFVDNTRGAASQWIVYANDSAHVITSTTATITGLDAHALYHVSVVALCAGNDTSNITDCGDIITACDAMPTPWSCGFETSEGYEGGSSYDPETTANFESNCWNVFNQKPGGATYPYAYVSTTASYVHSGTQGVYTYTGSAATKNLYMVLPAFSDPSNMLKVKFWYKNGSTATTYSQLIFGYFTDASSDTTFVPVDTMQRYSDWTEKEILTNTARYNIPANVRIGFLIDKAGTYGYGLYLDDISVNLIRSCSDPEVPTVSDITAASAKVAFTDTCRTHVAWEYVYGPMGFNPNNATPVALDTTVFSINGLTDETNYDVYVRAVCGVGDVSNYIKASFTTLCLPFEVTEETPFSDGFEYLPANTVLAGCYTVEGNSVSGSTQYYMKGGTNNGTVIYSHSGDHELYAYGYKTNAPKGQTAYRQFHLNAGKVYKASVWVRYTAVGNTASIVFGNAPELDSTTTVATLDVQACTAVSSSFVHCYEKISGYISIPKTGDYYIGLHADKTAGQTSNYIYMYFDDFVVEELAGCLPTVVTVDSASQNTVYAHHADTVAEHIYEYMVLNGTDTVVDPTLATSNPFSVSGLPSSSSLTLYVRQSCEGGNYSEWSTEDFNTACGAVSDYPYTQGFEGSFPPACWNQFSYGTPVNAWASVATATYVHSGSKAASIPDKQAGAKTALTTGEFNLTNPYGYYVRFWMYRAAASSYATKVDEALHVGYLNAPITAANISNVTELGMINRNVSLAPAEESTAAGYFMYEFEVPAGVLGSTWFSFDFHNQYGGGIYIDDVTIEPIPPCVTPKKAPVVVSTTMTTATVTVDMKDKSEAQVAWMAANDTAIAGTISTNNGTAIATGLNGNVQYAFMYRFICDNNDTSAWSPVGLGLTKVSDCFAPDNIRLVGETGIHSATLTWGSAPAANAYEYELYIGSLRVDSAVVTSDTVTFNSLASNVEYTLKVRTLCQDDSTVYQSANFKTQIETFTAPFVCDFENAGMNNNWTMRRLSTATTATNSFTIGNSARAGSTSMYISSDNVNYSYNSTATVADAELFVDIPAGNYFVDYDWNCAGRFVTTTIYDYGRVFLVPADYEVTGTTYAAFNKSLPTNAISLDDNAPLLGSNGWTHHTQMLTLDSAASYKLVVLWANSTTVANPPMAIDNFSIEEITCMPVKSVNVFSLDTTEAVTVIRRNDSTDVVYYALSAYNTADSITNWTLATADTIAFTGLTPNATYYFFARRSCSDTETSRPMMVSFTTTVNPVRTPFVCGFEANDPNLVYWTLTESTTTNYFTIGTGASSEGTSSLYVTDNGSDNQYTGSTSANASWAYAYVPLQFTSGSFEVSYSWRCHGESTYDYGHIFLAPASMIPQANVQLTGMAAATLPAGCIALDAEYTKLNLSDEWVDATTEVDVENAGAYNLIISWRNDASTVNQPPLAIDDISIKRMTCVKPDASGISLDSVSTDLLRVKVKGASTPIIYHVASDASFTDTAAYGILAVGDTIITATNLSASTLYYVHMSSVCAVGDTSSFLTLKARTACGTRTVYPFTEGFESYTVGTTSTYNNVLDEACWLVTESATAAYYYVTTTASYCHSGNKGLYIYNASTTGANQTFAMPQIDTLAGKQLSMWYKNYSATSGYAVLEVGYLTNPENTSSFVVVGTAPVITGSFSEFVVDYPSTVPANARPAFRANGTYYMYVDDIRINKVVEGSTFNETVCFGQGYTGHGFTCPMGTLIPGDSTLTAVTRSTVAGAPDSIVTINLHILNEIVVNFFDTICAGQPYTRGLWDIENPTTRVYPRTFTSTVTGCDSTVNLSLYVCPTQLYVRDTICQGDAYQFYGQTCTQTGTYVAVDTNRWGCTDTINLYLLVIDSTQITNASICQGQSYPFMGHEYTVAGTYRVPSTGAKGCSIVNILNLTVTTTDSICNVSFCQGGSVIVGDTTITTPGQYVVVRPAGTAGGCDIIYYITATETPVVPTHTYDYACEGKPYYGYGIMGDVITKDTTYTFNRKTLDGKCDSISYVHLTYVATKHTYESAQIVQGDVYKWQGRDLTDAGDYTETLPSHEGCDSIVHLHLSYKGQSVENVTDVNISIVPNPVTAGQTSFVYGNFTDVKNVEVLNSFGQVIDTFVPESYPIEVSGINAAGIYFVRVTTNDDKVAIQKLIVK